MSPESAFSLANLLVLPQWVLMAFAPRWRGTQMLAQLLPIPMILGVMYIYYLFVAPASGSGPALDFRAFGTIQGVMALMGNGQKETALAGWIHYLAFDLVAGSYILRDGQARAIPHGWLIPGMLLCFALGPIGLLLYGLIRLFWSNRPQTKF